MNKKDIIETINYAIKDINNGMEDSGIKELEDLVEKLEKEEVTTKEYDWRTDYDWTDPNDHPVEKGTWTEFAEEGLGI